MKRDERIFKVAYGKVEPTEYIRKIILKCNRNVLDGNDAFLGLEYEEIKDLCEFQTDPAIIQFKGNETASKWLKLAEKYK